MVRKEAFTWNLPVVKSLNITYRSFRSQAPSHSVHVNRSITVLCKQTLADVNGKVLFPC